MTVTKFKKIYGPGGQFKDWETAMETARDDYGPYLQGFDLTLIGAYARTLWLSPEKIGINEKNALKKAFKAAEKWAKLRADFRI